MYERSLSAMGSARYICILVLWGIDEKVGSCREEKVFERKKEGVYIPFTRTHVSKAVNVNQNVKVQLCDRSVNYLNT